MAHVTVKLSMQSSNNDYISMQYQLAAQGLNAVCVDRHCNMTRIHSLFILIAKSLDLLLKFYAYCRLFQICQYNKKHNRLEYYAGIMLPY